MSMKLSLHASDTGVCASSHIRAFPTTNTDLQLLRTGCCSTCSGLQAKALPVVVATQAAAAVVVHRMPEHVVETVQGEDHAARS